MPLASSTPGQQATLLRSLLPPEGLFQDKTWLVSPLPIQLGEKLFQEISDLGPRIHAFYKASNLLYRQSVEGKQPPWIHQYLDAGKSPSVIQMARNSIWKNELPRVIRPDLLVTDDSFAITELDSVPGGIGLTAWMQQAYETVHPDMALPNHEGMLPLFFKAVTSNLDLPQGEMIHVALVVSEESRDYRPEMKWLADQALSRKLPIQVSFATPEDLCHANGQVQVHGQRIHVLYRFFELFDLPHIKNFDLLLAAAENKTITITPPLKPQLEEKLWMALFWFPQLSEFWRRELGDRYFRDLKKYIPFTWMMDPSPLPPHASLPRLDIQDWSQLKTFTQKQRDLVLKISGFSEKAWGSRGVHVGSDLSAADWGQAVENALADFSHHPHILQPFTHSRLLEHPWYDFNRGQLEKMRGRLRLCPYWLVVDGKPQLGGIQATLCPADKKLIHGMQDSIITLAVQC